MLLHCLNRKETRNEVGNQDAKATVGNRRHWKLARLIVGELPITASRTISQIPLWNAIYYRYTRVHTGRQVVKSANNPQNRKILGEVVQHFREKAGLKQKELAEQLGQTQSFISKWESGQRRIDVLQVCDFCDVVGISLERFLRKLRKELESR